MTNKERFVNGYRLIYKPEHEGSYKEGNFAGWCYEHRFLMERELGRKIDTRETVHHLDCDKLNNSLDNLIIIDQASHAKIHHWINNGAKISDTYEIPLIEERFQEKTESSVQYCLICSCTLQHKQKDFCSTECYLTHKNSLSPKPSLEQLLKDCKEMSMVKVGKKYGVSDNAVRKWFKNYGLNPKNLP